MKAWMLLALAILFEVCGTSSMKLSEGFSKPLPTVGIAVFYILSFATITLVLDELDLSLTYAVWAGVGTALTVAVGVMYFGEHFGIVKAASIVLIILGVVGLHLSGTPMEV